MYWGLMDRPQGFLWQQMVSRTDRIGRTASIASDDDQDFCSYKYVGGQPIFKDIPKSGIEVAITSVLFGRRSIRLVEEILARRSVILITAWTHWACQCLC